MSENNLMHGYVGKDTYDENSKHFITLKSIFKDIHDTKEEKLKRDKELYVIGILEMIQRTCKGQNQTTPFRFTLSTLPKPNSIGIIVEPEEIAGAKSFFNKHGIVIERSATQKIAGVVIHSILNHVGLTIIIDLDV